MTDRGRAGERILLGTMRAGESEQFRAIYDHEFGFVWAAARRFGVPAAALEDVVQEVFITAFRRLDQLHYEVSPRAWLFGVTRKVASRHRRGLARLARRLAALAETNPPAIEEPHDRHEATQLLDRLLAQLPGSMRAVWEMTELLGMSGPEIASELGLPLNTVYSRLRIARVRLLELVKDGERLAGTVTAVRGAEEPPPGTARRTWAALAPVLGKEGGLTVTATWSAARTAMATTLTVAGAVVTGVALAEPPAAAGTRAEPVAVVEGRLSVRTDRSPTAEVRAAAPVIPVEPARPAGGRSERGDRLAAEVALIDRARAQLAAGDAAAALALLEAHAREFSGGSLAVAREAARVEALCLQGERAGAEAAARRLLAQLPGSPLARRFEGYACADRSGA